MEVKQLEPREFRTYWEVTVGGDSNGHCYRGRLFTVRFPPFD